MDELRVDTPRQESHTLCPPGTGYADMHTRQQTEHTTYADSEWREEWVDEEMRMEREVEMVEWE